MSLTPTKPRSARSGHRKTPPFALIALAITGTATAALVYGLDVRAVRAYLVCINMVTFGAYAFDKSAAARSGAGRVPERVLHVLAALGGTPGAWAARHALRHKTLKASFRVRFWLIAVLQCGLLIALWVYSRHHG